MKENVVYYLKNPTLSQSYFIVTKIFQNNNCTLVPIERTQLLEVFKSAPTCTMVTSTTDLRSWNYFVKKTNRLLRTALRHRKIKLIHFTSFPIHHYYEGLQNTKQYLTLQLPIERKEAEVKISHFLNNTKESRRVQFNY
ncbi:hypothetical protein OAB57_00860 [Bacteriovoracaceae bacterium]|nr:hypothetical protein [Bacteriovoracaceae bacterium]